jgi:hypothetical protein
MQAYYQSKQLLIYEKVWLAGQVNKSMKETKEDRHASCRRVQNAVPGKRYAEQIGSKARVESKIGRDHIDER